MDGRRILVIGAGFAGLYASLGMKRLAQAGHRISIVNLENFMPYQSFLPEVASGTIDPRAVVVPLRSVLRHCEVHVGEVIRLDHASREADVMLSGGVERRLGYDVLVLAPGRRRECSLSRDWPNTVSVSRRCRKRSTSGTVS